MSRKSKPATRDEVRQQIIDDRKPAKSAPVFFEDRGLGDVGNLIVYYKKLYRWDPEDERTLRLRKTLDEIYGVDMVEVHRQIHSVSAEHAKKLLGTGGKPRRLS